MSPNDAIDDDTRSTGGVATNGDPAGQANGADHGDDLSGQMSGSNRDGGSTDEGASTDRRMGSVVDASLVHATLAVVRARPRVFVPFLAIGLLGGWTALAKLESPIAVAPSPFPVRGYLHLPVSVVPSGQTGIEYGTGALLGLKPQFLAFLVALDLAVALVTAVALAIALWTIADGTNGIVPPVRRVGRLVSYVLVVQGSLLVAAYAPWAGVGGGDTTALLVLFLDVPFAIGLFTTPAYIVLVGNGPIQAGRESVALVTDRLPSIVAVVLLLGYAGYVLTGVATVVPDPDLGIVLGTILSTSVVGTVYTVAVFVVFRQRIGTSNG
ncbi:hypothetical protein C479_12072 [Halovivax asiaticus JCM 14624]|uniref:Uncharacterized protein n=1 Tax=Halovivax asiaticus JCM 14624 TaxID=1227490 RepID=M0BF75_9EURY|nr:hypothetical protein [Halovivax asiaticus]ELZ09122.1 hypothetical protein C479_12072 [Halovivax asiaticus JCM 14624]